MEDLLLMLPIVRVVIVIFGMLAIKMIGGKFEDHPYTNTVLTYIVIITCIAVMIIEIWIKGV